MAQEEITVKFHFDYFLLWPLKAFVYWVSVNGGRKLFSLVYIWRNEVKFLKLT